MAVTWMTVQNIKGIKYYEHASRLYKKKKDRNFVLQYRCDNKVKNETLGWESDGWTVEKAISILQELKQNQKTGVGPKTLAEKRESLKAMEIEQRSLKIKNKLRFSEIFEIYLKETKEDKDPKTIVAEKGHYNNWLKDIFGNSTLDQITPTLVESLKSQILNVGRAKRTAEYILTTLGQVINFARKRDLYNGDNPVSKIKKPKEDNQRKRFLQCDEAERLLDHLKIKYGYLDAYEMVLISLYTGFRSGEVLRLKWEDIDFDHNLISAKDKNKKIKTVIMTERVKNALLDKKAISPSSESYVFYSHKGGCRRAISRIFKQAVEELGLNAGINDPRNRVVFHTLRHTYASWLVMSGTDLYTTQKLMGHKTIAMTERYSHLAPEHLKKAVGKLEQFVAAQITKEA